MKKLLRNFLSAFLFVGILASCETTDPLIQEAQKNIFTQNFDTALAILDRSIEQNPESGLPHYYKAFTYVQKAAAIEEAEERAPAYRNFRESITTARDLFEAQEETPDEADDVNGLIINTWGVEHNNAIKYVNNDSLRDAVEEPLKIAVAHLKNAVIVNPDSTLSWDILAQVQFMDNNLEGAIEALENSMGLKSPPPSEDYLRLGIYYIENDQVDASIEALEEGLELYPDSVNLTQNLADSYMKKGDRASAISTVQDLIDRDPENAQYQLVLGTQLLQATSELSEKVSGNFDKIYDLKIELRNASGSQAEAINAQIDSLNSVTEGLTEETNKLSDRAETALLKVTELRPEDDRAYNFLGITYQNKYVTLFEKRNNTTDNELASEYDRQAKAELRQAMKYFEKAAELNPDETQYWDTLSRIYTTLDMQEKAEEALKKAGI